MTIKQWTRRIRKLYRDNGYFLGHILHAPKSNSVYFTVFNPDGSYNTEVRVSDHYHPVAEHRGWNFVTIDQDICEESYNEIREEVE